MLKILIADDEQIERRYLKNLLQKHRALYQIVGEAATGEEVLKLTSQLKPDVIIMDINMPSMNGLDSANLIKKKYPNICILLNTAYAEFEFARRALEYGLDAYLLKPAKEEEIIDAIEKCTKNRKKYIVSSASTIPENIGTSNNAIDPVIHYIDQNYNKNITLEELAQIAHFSSPYLSKVFHQATGLTIKTYITLKRIENAKHLLKNSKLSIQEIAVSCGFPNLSHFDRVFKQQTGMSPVSYRNN